MDKSIEQRVLVRPRWREYLELCKPRVVALICFTSIIGMLLAVPGWPPVDVLLFGNLGIFLAASAAAAINQIIDSPVDSLMERTQARPLPQGSVTAKEALLFATVLIALSVTLLMVFTNLLTTLLTMGSLIGYAVVYTMFLKRATPQNIVIGGAAGAAPPVLGWVAVTGTLHPDSLLLFLIIFAWTPPHFWALAIARRQEYAKADVPMLPVTHGVEFTSLHILLYTVLLLVVTVFPWLSRMSGLVYLVGAGLLGLRFIYWAVRLYLRQDDNEVAMATFWFSIKYLMGIFGALLVDHYYYLNLV